MEPTKSDSASLRAVGVYGRPECVFNYCPNPTGCKERDRCQHPAGGGVPEAGEQSGAPGPEPRKGLGAVNGSASELTLRACPFCGGGAELDTQQPYRNMTTGNVRTAVAIYCTKCSASMSVCREDVPDIEPEWLAGEWNRRTDEGKTPNDLSSASLRGGQAS